MTLLQAINKLNVKISKRTVFDVDIEKQKKYLLNFTDPDDLIERSYFQYKCQNFLDGRIRTFLYNLISLFLLYPFAWKFKRSGRDAISINQKADAVSTLDFRKAGLLPEELECQYEFIPNLSNLSGQLDGNDWSFIETLVKKYPLSPYFLFKCLCRIALYSEAIKRYSPKLILSAAEYSFTSSILTEFCSRKNIEHINIMHGEKLFDIRDSFVRFHKYYVWDQHYVDLMVYLGAEKEQFLIDTPECVKLDLDSKNENKYEITYYLGGESEKDLLNLRVSLAKTRIPKDKICLRYHPRYCDKQQINHIFTGFRIEDPIEVPINASISQTKYVVSLYSTVLYQAYKSGKSIMIDDVTNPRKFQKLKALNYIMISKPHLLLSKVINDYVV